MVELVVLVKGYSSYKFYVFWFKILCEDMILFRGGGFFGGIRSFISFCERMVFFIFVMMIGVSKLNCVI